MDASGKIIWIMVFAGVMTIWGMIGQPVYNEYLSSQGFSLGIGETYLGYIIPGFVTLILTAMLLRRTKKHE